jgi:hypothetical protein
VSSAGVVNASYKSGDPEVESAGSKMEADMFRAALENRQAYAKLKTVTGARYWERAARKSASQNVPVCDNEY